jgi:acyl carrier protein
MTTPNSSRISQIVSDVFGVSAEYLNDESSPDTIETWESSSHINLILSLEIEFDIQLSPEDAMDMLSVGLIRAILADHGITDDE